MHGRRATGDGGRGTVAVAVHGSDGGRDTEEAGGTGGNSKCGAEKELLENSRF